MSQYKLHYFNGRGAGELTRLVLAAAEVKYDDIRYTQEDWPKSKPNFPFQQLPVLEVDGSFINQSRVIAAFVAKQHGLAGATDLEWAQCHALVDTIVDMLQPIAGLFYVKDENEKKTKLAEYKTGKLKEFAGLFEKYFKENVGIEGFLVGHKLTYADLAFFDGWDRFARMYPTLEIDAFLKDYPTLAAHRAHIAAIQAIKNWVETRPNTAF